MKAEKYFKEWSQNCKIIESGNLNHSYKELIDFAEDYHKHRLSNGKVVFNFPPQKLTK